LAKTPQQQVLKPKRALLESERVTVRAAGRGLHIPTPRKARRLHHLSNPLLSFSFFFLHISNLNLRLENTALDFL
jgi:hypothetical protein